MPWKDYARCPHQDLVSHLCDITEHLAKLYEEVAFTRSTEHRAKMEAWSISTESSVTAREKAGSINSIESTIGLWELEAQIKALVEERDLIRLLLEMRRRAY